MSDHFCMRLFWHIHNIMICRTIYRSTLHYVTLQLLLSLVAEEELNWYILGNSNFQKLLFLHCDSMRHRKIKKEFQIAHPSWTTCKFLLWNVTSFNQPSHVVMNFILVLGREVPVYLVVEWQTKRKKDYEEKVGLKKGRYQAKRNKRRGEGGGEEPR